MARVLVTEKIADRGLDRLRGEGHDVVERLDLSPADLLAEVRTAHALLVRSATQVTAEVLAAAPDLVVVARAGIGLDNVDVDEATRRGVIVVNAPQSNLLSAAEHTMALLLAQARNVPQAHAALVAGRWERARWEGMELNDKVLGIVGLGNIGRLVAQRAQAFGMRVVAHDPFVAPERARQLNVDMVTLDELVRVADVVTVHVAKTPETVGLIGKDLLARAKPGIRIVNVARGGIVDEEALAEAIREGRVAGAALDVFAEEPTTASPLFGLDGVVVTPHLGASTREAQDKAGETIAEQVSLALAGEFVPYAVNVDASEAAEAVRPFLPLAERLGRIWASLEEGEPKSLAVDYQGQLADYDTRILTLAVLKGVLGADGTESVSYVNAPQLAEARGLDVQESRTAAAHDYLNLITLRGDGHSLAGSLFGLRDEARLVMVDDHTLDIPPARHMVVVRNDDRPGMIGLVGATMGRAGINISDMDVGVSPSGEAALMVLSTDRPPPTEVLDDLRRQPGILQV
ncbi:MAG TPA: phosphoglycerate dehydrogenase, partial [Acidimicrobiales bacterium]